MCLEDTVRIPLRARDGTVRAYAIVDAADADWVNQWRWCLNDSGYAMRNVRGGERKTTVKLHRELLGLVHGDGLEGDHLDRDRLNNRRVNLRKIPARGNRQNCSSNRASSSKYRGVCWSAVLQKWMAQVQVGRKNHYLGLFESESDAAEAARVGRLRLLEYAID